MKKVTLFVSSELQKLLAKTREWTAAYRVALSFFTELVIYGSSANDFGPWQSRNTPLHGGDGGGYAKWFCGCHAQSETTRKIFQNAQRVEGYARSVTNVPFPGLKLELRAYKRGMKEPFAEQAWWFPLENPQHKVVNPQAS